MNNLQVNPEGQLLVAVLAGREDKCQVDVGAKKRPRAKS
jgi:hypothetical protein